MGKLASANRLPSFRCFAQHILLGQEERLEELRDTHRLESISRSGQIDALRRQLHETEALLSASQTSVSEAIEEAGRKKADLTRLEAESERAKIAAKEEEEKRVKAISLLKTVRTKLVKAEKEKEDAIREATQLKEKENDEKTKDRAEFERLQSEVDAAHAEKETAVVGLRNKFDKEIANLKDRYEKEALAIRGQFELEAITLKVRRGFSRMPIDMSHP